MKSFLVLFSILASVNAFAPSLKTSPTSVRLFSTEADTDAPRMNPDKPELPEIKGDFDWDEKFGGDDDWIVDNVPGKMVLNEIDLAAQNTALTSIEDKYRKVRLQEEYDAARILGWTSRAETFNGRFAMFFLTVGLLTEYWTGVTIPGQIEEMLRVGGFIGPDY
eukprot:CAMPEP_0204629148 /NCGR_PEP_ID=MMETSP0717-20131115/17518_1 /ASSEMBLY_ACC=CAM_ASM_000666 /TAXON_ID=230516 /ORGANISM="Chaetoceros curvisetus" /LENGTH=163 /DNA_ID=CAMNT_0051645995 /DNA_START=35 /DNA_END=526 /DNA_ORIENTATION=-